MSIQDISFAYFQVWYTKENLEDYTQDQTRRQQSARKLSHLLRNRQEGHHNRQLVRILQPCKDLRRRYLCLSFRSHYKVPLGSHRPLPLNESSTATRWIKAILYKQITTTLCLATQYQYKYLPRLIFGILLHLM